MKINAWALLFAGVAMAIPPEDFQFPSAPNDTALTVAYSYNGNLSVVREGELFGAGITQTAPEIFINKPAYRSLASYNGSYLILLADPDARYPQQPNNRWYLHWLAGNMTTRQNGASSSVLPLISGDLGRQTLLGNASKNAVPYVQPTPPQNSSAHRYIFYAFQQPANFTIPPSFAQFNATNRAHFNLTQFIAEGKLGTPAAAMFMYVSNGTNVPGGFIAAPGSTYPGGNGDAVISGPGPSLISSAPTATSTATSTAGAAAMATPLGLVGAAVMGAALIL